MDDVLLEVANDDWKRYLLDLIKDDESIIPFVELSRDYYHKDNVSGGLPYAIEIVTDQRIDSLFLNEQHNTTFIDYLRICMENCGFPGIAKSSGDDRYKSFFDKVKPMLQAI